ncbi:MAG: hypothetical protein IKZ59_01530 [Clostridia bacterium]|nr:hypothetical protein [Clostridia bacterium]
MKENSKHENRLSPVILTVMALFVCAIVWASSYAAYTNSRNAQRTIAVYDKFSEPFSSNYLTRGYSRDNVRTLYVTDSVLGPNALLTVSNYAQGIQVNPCQTLINYVLSARLVRYDAQSVDRYVPVTAQYLSDNSLDDFTVTIIKGGTSVTLGGSTVSYNGFAGTLAGGVISSDSYAIHMSNHFVNQPGALFLEVTATPQGGTFSPITGIFKGELRAQDASNHWTGGFSDTKLNLPNAYDGFNYIVTGTGSGVCTVTWDTAKVVLSNESYINLMAISGATSSSGSITFPVNSNDVMRYDLQFYKVNITNETWFDMEDSVVTFDFE